MKNFHNSEYDGIVLKIPSWFIEMNELEQPIEALRQALKDSKKSMYYLDHVKNLDEIISYKDKKVIIQKDKLEKEARIEKERKRVDSLLNREMYQLYWMDEKSYFDIDRSCLRLLDEEFFSEDIFTRSAIKADFKRKFDLKLAGSYDNLLQFERKNTNVVLKVNLEGCSSDLIDINNYNLYVPNQGYELVGFSFRRLYIATEWRKDRNGNLKYSPRRLKILPDGSFGYDHIKLEGFTKSNMSLIKTT